MVLHAGVAQRLVERLVAVAQVHILADHGDGDFVLRVLGFVDQVVPALEVGRRRVQAQLVADQAVQALLVQHARHLVDRVDVPHGDHAPGRHVGEQRNLGLLVLGDRAVGAAQQGIGLDADLAQLLHGVLGRLGLEFAGGGNPGHVGEVHEGGVVGAHAQAHLARGFQERQGLDVADRAADLDDGHVHRAGLVRAGIVALPRGQTRATADVVLDLIGDVGNDLHGLAQVVATAFFLQHRLVDSAGGEIVHLAHARVDEALIVTQVKVGLGAVVGDEHLAVLER